ncbi:hypothetical protein C8J57DRAFT_1504337 [Mycena rebaudengoi]|nr:hypothetical protein C8J57DRAFT_1504337 [Mycena rebaudengoi]
MTSNHSYLGTILLGDAVNLVLFTAEVTQAVTYFRSPQSKKDKKVLRAVVCGCLLGDTAATAMSCISAYTYTVTGWGNSDIFVTYRPLEYLIVIKLWMTLFTTTFVHIFLVLRCISLSGARKHLTGALLWPMVAVESVGFGTALLITWLEPGNPFLAGGKSKATTIITYNTILAVILDLSITFYLLWKLYTFPSSITDTKRLTRRIGHAILATGSITALNTIGIVACWWVFRATPARACITFAFTCVNSVSMMMTLNNRSKMRGSVRMDLEPNCFHLSSYLKAMVAAELRLTLCLLIPIRQMYIHPACRQVIQPGYDGRSNRSHWADLIANHPERPHAGAADAGIPSAASGRHGVQDVPGSAERSARHLAPKLSYQLFFHEQLSEVVKELEKDIRRTVHATLRTTESAPPDAFLRSTSSFMDARADPTCALLYAGRRKDPGAEVAQLLKSSDLLNGIGKMVDGGHWRYIEYPETFDVPM